MKQLTLDEGLELFTTDAASVHLDLQRHQDCEEELVRLVQTPHSVPEGRVGQIPNDVLDTLGRHWRLLGFGHGEVKDAQELRQGGLVHDVHYAHLYDQEVEDTATRCNWKIIK